MRFSTETLTNDKIFYDNSYTRKDFLQKFLYTVTFSIDTLIKDDISYRNPYIDNILYRNSYNYYKKSYTRLDLKKNSCTVKGFCCNYYTVIDFLESLLCCIHFSI